MWSAILGLLNGLVSIADRFMAAWMLSKERQAGRDEVILGQKEQALIDLKKSNEIDARPIPTDRVRILDWLRKPR